MFILEIAFESKIEKNICNNEFKSKNIQNIHIFENIANALGGNSFIIHNYEYMFQIIDSSIIQLFNKVRLNIYI